MTDGTRRRPTLVVGAVVVVLLAAALVVGPVTTDDSDANVTATSVEDAKLVTVTEDDQLWPYTSRQRDVETRTLPINVVVHADLSTTRRVLAAGDDRTWTTTDAEEDEALVVNESSVDWSETTGADRYTYVETDEGGHWLDESAQVHDGAYLGARYHLRLYEVPSGSDTWTAIQAHKEHWDWFRLRHTVGSTARARYTVEHEFYGTGTVADVSRERFGNGGALDADGWVTVFDLVDWAFHEEALSGAALALISLVGGRSLVETGRDLRAAVERSRLGRVHVALFGTLVSLPLLVRVTAVTLERALPWLSPKVIAAPLYLVLAVGLPLVAGLLGRRLPADEAFATATVGLGLGLLLDYSWLGLTTLPFGVVVHRLVLLVGLGLVAAGGVRWATAPMQRYRYRLVGVAIWGGALVWPLAGL